MVAAPLKRTLRRRARSAAVGGFLLVCSLIADGAFGHSPFGKVWPGADRRLRAIETAKRTLLLPSVAATNVRAGILSHGCELTNSISIAEGM